MPNDNVLTEPRDAISRSKRILALVDEYHENPTRDTRTALRAALMDEFQPEPRAEVTHGDTTMGECMASLLDRLEVAELYADRYRYLRERPLDAVSAGGVFAGKTPDNVVLNGADLDAAIDAAMKEVN